MKPEFGSCGYFYNEFFCGSGDLIFAMKHFFQIVSVQIIKLKSNVSRLFVGFDPGGITNSWLQAGQLQVDVCGCILVCLAGRHQRQGSKDLAKAPWSSTFAQFTMASRASWNFGR